MQEKEKWWKNWGEIRRNKNFRKSKRQGKDWLKDKQKLWEIWKIGKMKFSINKYKRLKRKLIDYLKSRKGRNSRWKKWLRGLDNCKGKEENKKDSRKHKMRKNSLNFGKSEMKNLQWPNNKKKRKKDLEMKN